MFMIVLTCSAGTTADIRRVVTALDASDKAIALFDSRHSRSGRHRQLVPSPAFSECSCGENVGHGGVPLALRLLLRAR
jgi:hypothetical protein